MGSELKKELQKFLSAINVFAKEDKPATKTDAELKVSDMSVGGKVEIIGEDGELKPALDGDHKQGDKSFTVKDGVIASIEGEEAPKEEQKKEEDFTIIEETPTEEAKDEFADIKTQVEELKSSLDSIRQTVESFKGMIDSKASAEELNSFSTHVSNLTEVFSKFVKTPAEPTKTNTSPVVKEDKEQKMIGLANAFARLKGK